jgi:hypothetical protein
LMEDNCICANSYYSNKPQLKLQTETTNQATFKAYPIPSRQEINPPKVIQKRYDPEVLKSSYSATYTKPQNLSRSQGDHLDSISQHLLNKPKNVPFYSDTSYKQSYPKHNVRKKQSRLNQRDPLPMSTSPRTQNFKESPTTNRLSSKRKTPIFRVVRKSRLLATT